MTMLEDQKTSFTKEILETFDKVAEYYLFLNEKDTKKRKIYEDLKSVLYKEKGSLGGSLFICLDGSVLFAANCVSRKVHVTALEQGIRTNPKMLFERRYKLEEELFEED